jgi:predicted nucleic acid-binding protein
VIVVSDASPIISLAAVQQTDLLRHLYSEVLIPEAVHLGSMRDSPL